MTPREKACSGQARPLLQARNVTVRYGNLTVLNEITIVAYPGEIVGVIGPNGAGKSTLVNAITGTVRAGGQFEIGTDSLHGPPHMRARAGVARTFQTPELFDTLTGRDNVHLATCVDRGAAWRARGRRHAEPAGDAGSAGPVALADTLLTRSLLAERAALLPSGERKLLELVRALARDPRVLLLDEPAAGLPGPQRGGMLAAISHFVDVGNRACLLIEHDMDMISSTCDWIYVISSGELLAEGTWREVSQSPEVRAAYLGG
jgi:ABC-type branched-subunit amino acid transport system ATPase component